MTERTIFIHRGEAFESGGSGKFAKDVLRVGRWIHPDTKRAVEMPLERVARLVDATNKYLANGNKVPFPKGHSFDPKDNLGFWPGPFIVHKNTMVGVVQPLAKFALDGIMDKTLDAVSAYIEGPVQDPEGNRYDEVVTHICATNYPVITRQADFVRLSTVRGSIEVSKDALIAFEDLSGSKGGEGGENGESWGSRAAALASSSDARVAAELAALAFQRSPEGVAIALEMAGGVEPEWMKTFESCTLHIRKERGVDEAEAGSICAALKRKAGIE